MAITLRNVQFSYPNAPQKKVLSIPEWSVDAGDRVFLHGPSGEGKSTLLHILSGVEAATSGETSVLGQRLDKMSTRKRDRFRANNIGYVFQQFNLIPYLSPKENIALATQFCQKIQKPSVQNRAESLLEELMIPHDIWNAATSTLSIGQQQRVAIARALVNNPALLIADEPTSSLDENNRDNFMSLLIDLVKEHEITLVFVSHDMNLSTHFSRTEALSKINQAGKER